MARLLVPALALLLSACTTVSPEPDPSAEVGANSASPTPSPASTPQTSDLRPHFQNSVRPIGPALRDRMRFSHRADCPVPITDLRYLRMSYVGFDDRVHLGEMVVHRDHAQSVTEVFRKLYDASWPIRRMRLVDDYEGDDNRSMAANNTSAYNCRRVTGTSEWSDHAFGAAIDINPVQNPYVQGAAIAPPAGRPFADIDRSADAEVPTGVIKSGDVVVDAFTGVGWEWGGEWVSSKDYQHFSASGG